MAKERIHRQVDRLLDEIESLTAERNWGLVRELAEDVLALHPANDSAQGFLAAARRRLGRDISSDVKAPPAVTPDIAQPTAFAKGRYQVKEAESASTRRTTPSSTET